MLASRAESYLSGSIEVFQQPDKPPTCGSHGPRSLSSYRNKRLVGPEKIGDAGLSTACIFSSPEPKAPGELIV